MLRDRLSGHWPRLPSVWAGPPPDQVDGVRVQIARLGAARLSRLEAVLTDGERARAARYHRAADRLRSVVARGGLRLLLGRARGEPPERVVIERTGRGKPYCSGGPHFSLAHAGDAVLFAFSSAPVGVDIEPRSAGAAWAEALAGLSAPEQRAVWAAADRAETFLRIWTANEALAKAHGTGLLADAAARSPAGHLVFPICEPGLVGAIAVLRPRPPSVCRCHVHDESFGGL